jgi:Plasmid pRiA4b ORF-3-like protein
LKVYCIKVALFHNKRTYRNIEIIENQSLADLHESIFFAYDRDDEHLYSFFLTGKAMKSIRRIHDFPEITHPMNMEDLFGFSHGEKHNAEKTKIQDLDLIEKDKFYYLFDFGDDWWHELTVLKIEETSTQQRYPRIVKTVGESPEQYPDPDDDDYDYDYEDEE